MRIDQVGMILFALALSLAVAFFLAYDLIEAVSAPFFSLLARTMEVFFLPLAGFFLIYGFFRLYREYGR